MGQLPPETGHADDIIGSYSYEASLPRKKGFLPWHRPRKQYVRQYQWLAEIEQMFSEAMPQQNMLRYLGLPGIDLLDLRYFHDHICHPAGRELTFLGFNTSAGPKHHNQTDLNISLDEVRKLPHVHHSSIIIPDDFRNLADQNSIAWQRAHSLGPYHVINLDLCDGFGRHAPSSLENTHYDAVRNLLALQAHFKDSWLLLLTTRAGKDHIHADVLQRLLDKYLQNLADCPSFQRASAEAFTIYDELHLRKAVESSHGLLVVFLVGLCKWLAGLAVSQQPPTKVEVRNVIGYRVAPGAEQEDLVSLALRFSPTFAPVQDSVGLANRAVNAPSECEIAVNALSQVATRRNVDTILAEDAALHDKMATAMANLLEIAGYDVTAFHHWRMRFA